MVGSDCWVGAISVILYDYTSGGARVISVFSDGYLSYMYFYSVAYRDATSVYSYNIVVTSLVWLAVCGGSSILSIQLALYFAFSIL